jgi:post-segregation antitoxin (ccd killing protein)
MVVFFKTTQKLNYKTGENNMQAETKLNRDKQETRAINVRVPKQLYDKVRIYGIKQDKKLKDVVIEALQNKIETA